jgi:hypothetical protein
LTIESSHAFYGDPSEKLKYGLHNMRGAIALSFLVLLCGVLTSAPPIASSELDRSAEEEPNVKVSLAVPEGYKTVSSPLHVIIENVGNTPQQHFEEWNSWGYGNLSVEWSDESGNEGTVSKVPGSWDRNGPTTVTLQPGDALVREISFDEKLWRGWPKIKYETTLTLKVVYRAESHQDSPGWIGTVEAKSRAVLFR